MIQLELFTKIPSLPQRKDSLDEQVRDLTRVAVRLGMYDAVDWIRKAYIAQTETPKRMLTVFDPCISIDRAVKKVAVFDGCTLVSDFVPYANETKAIADATAWLKDNMAEFKEPRVVYPKIHYISAP